MVDQSFRNTDRTSPQTGSSSPQTGSSSHGFETAASSARSAADQALSAGRDLKDKASEIKDKATETASFSADAIKNQASDLVGAAKDAAKGVASQATDKIMETVGDQRNAGAEYVGNLAATLRRAAREFDKDLPIAGSYIRKAATQVAGVSETIKNGNVNDLVRGAQDFARRQPTAFMGLAVLAGFGVVRFLKSTADSGETGTTSTTPGNYGTSGSAGGRPTYNEGYRDGRTR
jgi:hypothetical protein